MITRRISAFGAGVAIALIGGAVAWTQQPAAAPPRPVPTEINLTPSRGDNAALARARQDPLAARARGALNQGNETGQIVARTQTSDVPVLAPADPALLATARYTPGDRFYMLTLEEPGRIIEIYGATKAFQPAAGAPPRAAPAPDPQSRRRATALAGPIAEAQKAGLAGVTSERTEYGVDVAFSRFGAAYNVSFICDQGGSPDCSDAAAIQFAAGLQLIGGGQ